MTLGSLFYQSESLSCWRWWCLKASNIPSWLQKTIIILLLYNSNTLVNVALMYSQIFRTSKGNLWIKRANYTVVYFCMIAGCYSFEETCPPQSSKYFMLFTDYHSYWDVESRAPLSDSAPKNLVKIQKCSSE